MGSLWVNIFMWVFTWASKQLHKLKKIYYSLTFSVEKAISANPWDGIKTSTSRIRAVVYDATAGREGGKGKSKGLFSFMKK